MFRINLNTLCCCFILVFINNKISAQRLEVGIMVGASNYVGDLAPSMVGSETNLAGGIFGRYNISPSFAFTASYFRTQLSGDDKNFAFNQPRNLSFRNNIKEYAGVIEFNFLKYALGVLDKKYTSYVFLGLGYIEHRPETFYQNAWYDLRSLQTENVEYGTRTMVVPFGMGFKWKMNPKYALEANFGFRKTYSDYLDDVSTVYPDPADVAQRKGPTSMIITDRTAENNNGVPQNRAGYRRGSNDFNDWYMIASISLTYRIFKQQSCPRFY